MTIFEAASRWSFAVRCERMGAYALRGATPEEPDEITQGFFRRGKQLETDVYDSLELQYGADDLIRSKPIPWPAGIAHGDIFIRSLGRAIEIKSAADPRPLDAHLLQLAGQILFDDDAQDGALCVVNPSNLMRCWYPMPVITDEMAERVHEVAQAVAVAADPASPLPERVCSRPSDAQSHMCPFGGICFQDWSPPDPVELETELAAIVPDLDAAEKAVSDARRNVKDLEVERDLLRDRFRHVIEPATMFLAPDDELVVGITRVEGRVTWDVATAIKMGAVSADALEPFRKVGKPSERWKVRNAHVADTEPQDAGRTLAGLVADFGEVPF